MKLARLLISIAKALAQCRDLDDVRVVIWTLGGAADQAYNRAPHFGKRHGAVALSCYALAAWFPW